MADSITDGDDRDAQEFDNTETEILDMMEGYPLLIEEYNILKDYVEENFGFDIHALGN